MTQNIVALIDGSIYSQSVCDHAAWVAARTGMPVELLHVLGRRETPEKRDLSGAIRLGARPKLMQELADLDEQRSRLVAQHGRTLLEEAHSILSKAGVSEITTRMRHGDIVETVAEMEEDAGVIIIGKRGEAADFAKNHLGSNLERIARASRRTVFVASRAFQPIQKVLVAYDGGPSAKKALDLIARMPLFVDLAIHIVTVAADSPSIRKGLESAATGLRDAGYTVTTDSVEGQPDVALGKLVEEQGFNLVVMGAYGHSRIRSLVIGSTTTEMMRSCRVPVVLVR
jgi:nucleotide-binding universal stress UspA family protein